jgi:dolichol-phosphate mannosyltransferase
MHDKQLVSIIVPVYNEAPAIEELLRRIIKADIPHWLVREVVIVDDGSCDSTVSLVESFIDQHPEERIVIHRGLINHGKGAALRAGFQIAKGSIFLIQDGDLEYSPQDHKVLLDCFKSPDVQVVYGSRFKDGVPKGMKLKNVVANLILTAATRLLFGQNISDEATGYKVFRKSVLSQIDLRCRGFEFCPEFTAKVSRLGIPIHETAISYNPRGILEGKKIRAWDGWVALCTLVKFRLWPTNQFVINQPATVRNLSKGTPRQFD